MYKFNCSLTIKCILATIVIFCFSVSFAFPDASQSTLDTAVMRRSPTIDGIILPGEWDKFYSANLNSANITTYANWDNTGLYFAFSSNEPTEFLILLDLSSDGWFHGNDNYEIRATVADDNTTSSSFSYYDSKLTSKGTPQALPEFESNKIVVTTDSKDNLYTMEILVPADIICSNRLSSGSIIGLHISSRPLSGTDWYPSPQIESTRSCSSTQLVTRKLASLMPVDIGLDLRSDRVARGEELFAKFHLTNLGAESVPLNHFIIAGEGLAGPHLSSEKIRIESLLPKQHVSHDFKTIIPSDMPLGSWVLGAEAHGPNGRVGGGLISFLVVEPIEVSLQLPSNTVPIDAEEVTFRILIRNNTRNNVHGNIIFDVPEGWELWKNVSSRDFSIKRHDSTIVVFKAKPPLGATGTIPLKASALVNGDVYSDEAQLILSNP